jgi:hypothetical protein
MQPVRVYKYFCLLLQVEVLGLAGFLYPSSGLLPWQEPGRPISRTEGSYPRQQQTLQNRRTTTNIFGFSNFETRTEGNNKQSKIFLDFSNVKPKIESKAN